MIWRGCLLKFHTPSYRVEFCIALYKFRRTARHKRNKHLICACCANKSLNKSFQVEPRRHPMQFKKTFQFAYMSMYTCKSFFTHGINFQYKSSNSSRSIELHKSADIQWGRVGASDSAATFDASFAVHHSWRTPSCGVSDSG